MKDKVKLPQIVGRGGEANDEPSEWDKAREEIATMEFERGLGPLTDFYDGLENIPAELLDRQWEHELAYADLILSLDCIQIKAEDQSLPIDSTSAIIGGCERDDKIWDDAYKHAQQDMDGWMRVVDKEVTGE